MRKLAGVLAMRYSTLIVGMVCVFLAAASSATAVSYDDVATGGFGDGPTWGQVEPWAPLGTDTFTIDGFTVAVTETGTADAYPVGATVNVNSGGTLKLTATVDLQTPVFNGTFNLNGGAVNVVRSPGSIAWIKPQMLGTINVNANTYFTVTASSATDTLGIGIQANRAKVTGSGDMTFDIGGGSAAVAYKELNTSTYSGKFIVKNGPFNMVNYRNATGITNSVELWSSTSLWLASTTCEDINGATVSGTGVYKAANGASDDIDIKSGSVISPSAPSTGGAIGTLTFGNSNYNAVVPKNVTFKSGSYYDLDVTAASGANTVDLISGTYSTPQGEHGTKFVIDSGAKLRPTLYTPTVHTALHVKIMTANNGITNTFDTFDLSRVTSLYWKTASASTTLENLQVDMYFNMTWGIPPTAEADGDYSVSPGDNVTLSGLGSSDPDCGTGTITYDWDLDGNKDYNDGVSGISPNVEYDYLTKTLGLLPGDHTIWLRVTDSDGDGTGEDSAKLTIGAPVPEPGTWLLVGTGVLGLFGYLRRRRMS